MSSTDSPPRRLVRRTDDRVVAGVASGLADLLRIDPVLVRIGFVVLAFAGGSGIIAYAALWAFTPEVEGGAAPVGSVSDRGPAFWIAVGLFVLAALVIADSVADRSVVWPLVLIGAGVALWRTDGTRSQAVATPPAPTDSGTWTPPPTPQGWSRPAAGDATTTTAPTAPVTQPGTDGPGGPSGGGPVGPGGGPSDWTPPPARTRERSLLGRLTIGVALLTVGVLVGLDRAEVLEVTLRDGIAVALLVLGLGLVVGGFLGRARWLIAPALLLLVPGLVATTALHELDIPFDAGIGERDIVVADVDGVADLYEVGIGQLDLDLGRVDMAGERVETTVRVGLGQALVTVPEDVTVEVDWELDGGQLRLFGDQRSGRSLDESTVYPGREGAGRIVLHLDVGFGEVDLRRAVADPFEDDVVEPRDDFEGIELGVEPTPAFG